MSTSRGLPVNRLLPFHLVVVVESNPYLIAGQPGYQHTAKAVGVIDGEVVDISVNRSLGWVHAEHLSQLIFYLSLDGKALVPLINTKNRA